MAITEQTPRKLFTATAGQTEFDYSDTFTITDITTTRVKNNNTELTRNVDYTVNISTGVVTLTDPATLNDTIAVYRETPIERASSFLITGEFRTDVLSDDLDNIVRILQELRERADRTIRYSENVNIDDDDVILPPAESGDGIGWDTNGRPTNTGDD